MKNLLLLILLILLITLLIPPTQAQTGDDGFASDAFRQRWSRTDAPVAAGSVTRSWIWGAGVGQRRYERFAEAPGGARLVQYFDKARMEVTDPAANPQDPWFVTNGLLVVELISGQVQVGLDHFEDRAPADLPVAGDPVANPEAPTYAQLGPLVSIAGSNRAPDRRGERVSTTFGAAGVGEQPDLALPETTIVAYAPVTGHNLPQVFVDFMQAQPIDPLATFGYPISEPYWIRAHVGGQVTTLLFQAFERRTLTYTPTNPPDWQVEMGNVGQHYVRWRYGHPLRYAQPPLPEGVRTQETSITLPTYDYNAALVPTTPDDPVYPYPRLDRALVGPPQPQNYRLLVVENQFLRLTFLPELGGRLYQAIDKASGQNIFYQNPVIKPSPFGQRGWWLGVGGLEWAAPTEEHGYLEYLPWDFTLEETPAGLTVQASTIEAQTGLRVTGRVGLPADEGRFRVALAVANSTGAARPLQMWTNAALAPGARNDIGPGLQFVAPTERMIVHATQDAALPAPGEWFTWPGYAGRDFSLPANWTGYVGAFSPQPIPFLGVYDRNQDAGAVVVHGPDVIGAKIFGFSDNFDLNLYTDDGSEYVELWSGAQPTFWDYPPLPDGATRAITTDWLPLWGLGDLATATADGALGLTRRADGGLTVTLASARIISDATIVVRLDGQELFRSIPLTLRPDLPLAIDLPTAAATGQVQVEAGELVLEAVVP
jgi:hypothetical protein